MKFAFSSAAVPGWEWREVVARAKSMGYDGVEWAGPVDPEVAKMAHDAGVEVACISTDVVYRGRRSDDGVSRGVVEAAIDTAGEMACPLVRVLDAAEGRESDVIGFGEFLQPLTDHALDRNVTLVVENALTFRTARAMWAVLDRLQHPALGACWNLLAATEAGESPFVSVPVLNSRIRYVRVGDATVGGRELPTKAFIERLRGIGYQGYLCVGYGEVSEAYLAETVKRLQEWSRPATAKGKAAAAVKPAAAAKATTP